MHAIGTYDMVMARQEAAVKHAEATRAHREARRELKSVVVARWSRLRGTREHLRPLCCPA